MATGDAALEAGMDILTGLEQANTIDTEINKSRDYIAGFAAGVRSVAAGGTGADNPAQARTNLGAVGTDQIAPGNAAQAGKIPSYNGSAQLTTAEPTLGGHAASKQYADTKLSAAGGTISGDLGVVGQTYMPNLSAVTSSYVAMFRNVDGRVGISPSALRFKKEITDRAYTVEQLRAIRVVSYRLKAAVFGEGWEDAPVDVGVIAEELIEAGLAEFVVFDENGEALSVHYERLSLVAIGALQEALDHLDTIDTALDLLAQRLTALEAGDE